MLRERFLNTPALLVVYDYTRTRTFSLCSRSRNRSFSFRRTRTQLFLEHVRVQAEEVVLVDTSSDGSVSSEFRSRYENVNVVRSQHVGKPFDFSRERNESLEHATHQWLLVLDPDERIQNWNAVRNVVAREENIAYLLIGDLVFHQIVPPKSNEKPGESHMFRLFQNCQGYNFSGNVYEELAGVSKKALATSKLDCEWEHHQTVSQRLEHAERYAKITGVCNPLPEIMRDLGTATEQVRKMYCRI